MLISNDLNNQKSESESITLRIGKPILDDLREANSKLKSVNTLVNQIIKTYIIWHKHAKKAGLAYFDNVLISDIINHLSDEQIIHIAEQYCKERLSDIEFMLNGENCFSSFLNGILIWLDASGFNYKYDTNGDFKTLLVNFNMGKNWSLYFKTYMQVVLEHYNITGANYEMTDNAVVIRIRN